MTLSENLSVPEDNIEAIREFQDALLKCRDDYVNDLPKKKVSSFAYKYKCRTNWWNGISYDLDYFKGKIDDISVLEKIDKIFKYINEVFKDKESNLEKFRTKEELDKIDELLTELINELDNLLK